jgi:Cu(I)/Ag(I) efflux system membrane protein CusA/SilA
MGFCRDTLDAIPDLSDTQVIVYTKYPGQAPQVIEDQVIYPLTTAMLIAEVEAGPRLLVLWRLFVYIIFEDGTPPEPSRSSSG